ncbi:hypothetical protein FBY12_3302 [Pseudomonas sp. SJZ131]|nr:hypothetical protein FBY12_3302 [Pseudomonas sp. SJZ131]
MAPCQSAKSVTERMQSRAGSLLQGLWVGRRFCAFRKSIVGASLLAMAPCQSAKSVTERMRSRAGSLLQGLWVGRRFCVYRRSIVGVSLLAMAPCQSTKSVTERMRSRAGSLLQVSRALHPAVLRHRQRFPVADDEMVEHAHVDQFQRLLQASGEHSVGLTRLGVTGGVVVAQDHRCGVVR